MGQRNIWDIGKFATKLLSAIKYGLDHNSEELEIEKVLEATGGCYGSRALTGSSRHVCPLSGT